jgi:[ribosomal protein S5]-alanine N-acetyltransferase
VKFNLRPFKESDAEVLTRHANNPNIARFMTNGFPHPYTVEHARSFIKMANRDNPVHIFAIEVEGEAAGGIGIHPQSDIHIKNAELGYWLSEQHWSKGIITSAVKEILAFAFANYDISRVYARPFGSNFASQRVLGKTGFVLEARLEQTIYKLGHYEDELIYGYRRPEKR